VNTEEWGRWTLGVGTVLGWSVDLLSGAMRDLETDKVVLEMKPEGSTSIPGKVLDKTVDIAEAILGAPKAIVDQTSKVVLDTTVRASSESIGLADDEKREEVESEIEGKKIQDYYENLDPAGTL